MQENATILPLMKLRSIEGGENLVVYAINSQAGQIIPVCYWTQDAFLSVQQGTLQLNFEGQEILLQPRDGKFLPAGIPFELKSLTDARARMVISPQAQLEFTQDADLCRQLVVFSDQEGHHTWNDFLGQQ